MSEVKLFKVEGRMKVGGSWQKFGVEVRALKLEEALEKIYSNIGGRHKLKRFNIRVDKIDVVKLEEAT